MKHMFLQIIADILLSNAEACGYRAPESHIYPAPSSSVPPPTVPPGRLKGKARKEAKMAAAAAAQTSPISQKKPAIKLPTTQIIVQATVVVGCTKPKVTMPISIQTVLQRAIDTRKRCTDWFQSTVCEGGSNIQESNAKHEYFIQVLQRARDILEPCFQRPKVKEGSDIPQDDPVAGMSNRFEVLEVEDIEDEDIGVTTAKGEKQPPQKATKALPATVECDVAPEADVAFIIFCFFEDLHRTQDVILDLWEDYRDGALDLMTASLTTNLALELVRKAEEDIKTLFPAHENTEGSYEALTSVLHPVPDLLEVVHKQAKMPEWSELGSFVYLTTYFVLEKFRCMHSRFPTVTFPVVLPIQQLYTGSSMKITDWLWEKDNLLSQMLLDLDFRPPRYVTDHYMKLAGMKIENEFQRRYYEDSFPVEDEITKALHSLSIDGIDIWTVFAAQILFEIHHILKDNIEEPYKKLRQRGANATATLNFTWGIPMKEWEVNKKRMKDFYFAGVDAIGLSCLTKHVVEHNTMVLHKQKWLHRDRTKDDVFPEFQYPEEQLYEVPEEYRAQANALYEEIQLRCRYIHASEDPTFYFKHNPVYCGMESLKLALSMEKAGIQLANHFGSFVSTSYLYVALDDMGLVKERWTELEEAYTMNIAKIFKGALPVGFSDIMKRFMLTMGFPAQHFAKNSRKTQTVDYKYHEKKRSNMIAVTEISEFLKNYFDGTDGAEKLLHNLLSTRPKPPKRHRYSLTHLEMLWEATFIIPSFLPRIEADHIGMTRKCRTLLLSIRKEIKDKLGLEHYVNQADISTCFSHWNVMMVLGIFMDVIGQSFGEGKTKLAKKSAQKDSPEVVLKGMLLAGTALGDFLREQTKEDQVQPFDVVSSTADFAWTEFNKSVLVEMINGLPLTISYCEDNATGCDCFA